jgi:hypothetical protein
VSVLGPVAFPGAYQALADDLRIPVRDVAPMGAGVFAFLAMWAFIEPMTGFLWRFQMPVFPVALLAVALLFRNVSLPVTGRYRPYRPGDGARLVLAAALLVALVAVPLATYRTTTTHHEASAPEVAVGEALAEYEDEQYAMFVTEGGALPYYSGWRAMDEWGLNSEYVGRNGLDVGYIERFDPDLVVIASDIKPGMVADKSSEVAAYLSQSDFVLAAVVQPDDSYVHLYFLQSDVAKQTDVGCTLRTVDRVDYVDADRIRPLLGDVTADDPVRFNCG